MTEKELNAEGQVQNDSVVSDDFDRSEALEEFIRWCNKEGLRFEQTDKFVNS